MHRVFVQRTQREIPQLAAGDIAVCVANVGVPTIMRETAIGFEDKNSFHKEVNSAYTRDPHLQLVVKRCAGEDKAKYRLLPRLRPSVEEVAEVLKRARKRREDRSDVSAIDEPLEERVIDRRDCVPGILAARRIDEGVDESDAFRGRCERLYQSPPMHFHTTTVFMLKRLKTVSRAARTGNSTLEVHVRGASFEGKHSTDGECGRARNDASNTDSFDDASIGSGGRVPIATNTHKFAASHCRSERPSCDSKADELVARRNSGTNGCKYVIPGHVSSIVGSELNVLTQLYVGGKRMRGGRCS